jgi:GTP-binding protein
VLADVGLVGRPNAGKSTFLSTVSRAQPKIADYPFTTTRPHLGIAAVPQRHSSLVIADIPGLIEDSHTGKGLGIQFLKHIERPSILAIMVDAQAEDPLAEAQVLLHELQQYSPTLAQKPLVHILSKIDTLADNEQSAIPAGWLGLSSVTGAGTDTVLQSLYHHYTALHPQKVTTESDVVLPSEL